VIDGVFGDRDPDRNAGADVAPDRNAGRDHGLGGRDLRTVGGQNGNASGQRRVHRAELRILDISVGLGGNLVERGGTAARHGHADAAASGDRQCRSDRDRVDRGVFGGDDLHLGRLPGNDVGRWRGTGGNLLPGRRGRVVLVVDVERLLLTDVTI